MKLLILSQSEVEQLLPMAECITVMEEALSSLARGEMHQPLRQVVHPPGADGVIAMMPSFRSSGDAVFGLKAICVFPKNAELGKDAHQGGVLLFRGDTGEPMAFMNASAITAIRTAAVSAVATQVLSREDASELAIIGAGVQARSHLEAMACVRKLKKVRVTSRNPEHAKAFAAEMGARFEFPIEPVTSAEEAITGADIIVTVTTSKEPVVHREWLGPGSHINAIGTYSPRAREIDTATMVDATLFVDRRESALNEAGDYLIAAAVGAITPDHIHAELGEVLIGSASGRSSDDEITLFKSLGLAIEDLAAADYVFRKARHQQVGAWVEF
ncbi:MAG TPA: ornithine cyclodeaminase family protein [Pyrinomonadaceae bacterium]|nr:ornithine cyclodeaminase family protein [Pyrinomonadaceae bacterium]